jgi:hypothetical protein
MEERKCGRSILLYLNHERASLSMLFLKIIHEDSWEHDSYWCFGLQKNEDCEYLKEGNSTIRVIYWLIFERTNKITKYYEVGFVLEGANRWG